MWGEKGILSMIKWLPLFLFTGCMSNDSLRTMSMSQDNIWNLSRLCIGMSESQVLQIMHSPYSKKMIETVGETYEIWFYVTKPSGLDQSRLVRQNLTPLTFQNGVLKGWGYEFYQYTLKNLQPKPLDLEQKEPPKSDEDRSLEKAIEGTARPLSDNQTESKKKKAKKGKEKNGEPKESSEPLEEKDREMIQEGEDQNFNFW